MSRVVACAAVLSAALEAQVMVFDRGLPPGADTARSLEIRPPGAARFIGDDFTIGAAGEHWVIDRVRTWAVQSADSAAELTGRFGKIALYGAIANDPPQKDEAECACHALPVLGREARISRVPAGRDAGPVPGLWQVDFEDLRWSVPGGVKLQFGIQASVWFNQVAPARGHRLRVFGPTAMLESWLDQPVSINLQVWGHLMATVKVEAAGASARVTLFGEPALDVRRVDLKSLRFGPGNSAPAASGYQDRNSSGLADLILTFPDALANVPHGPVSVCLTGGRSDGIPFEGCDLIGAPSGK